MVKFVEGFAAKLVVPADTKDIQVFDDKLPGFGIRKFASGAASYFVKFNVGAQQRRLSLGAVVKGNLKDMRVAASRVLAQARLGTDVVAVAKAAAAKSTVKTLGEVVPEYLEARASEWRAKSLIEMSRYLAGTKDKKGKERTPSTFKALLKMPIDAITRDDVTRSVDDIARTRGKTTADRAKAALSGLFAWAMQRPGSGLGANPAIDIEARSKNGARTRKLTEAELIEVWQACLDDDYGAIIKLLLLTGCRREEIGELTWSEINLEYSYVERDENGEGHDRVMAVIELPEHRTQNGREHLIPLCHEALALLPVQGETRDFVFGLRGEGFTGWTRSKAELLARIAEARKGKPMPHWTVHDLRRTVSTMLRERRLADPHLAELIINHVGGTRGGVAGVYDRSERLEERRRALERWGAYVARLVAGGTGKVVPMKRQAAS